MTDTRFERVTFVSDALPLRQSVEDKNDSGRGRGTFAGSVKAPGAAAGCCEKAGCGAAKAAPSGACGGGGGAYWTGGGALNAGCGGGARKTGRGGSGARRREIG